MILVQYSRTSLLASVLRQRWSIGQALRAFNNYKYIIAFPRAIMSDIMLLFLHVVTKVGWGEEGCCHPYSEIIEEYSRLPSKSSISRGHQTNLNHFSGNQFSLSLFYFFLFLSFHFWSPSIPHFKLQFILFKSSSS